MVATRSVPELAADLDTGLRRLKLAAIRRTAREVLLTATTQRWTPRSAAPGRNRIAARDASNVVNRLKAAGFPVASTRESFCIAASPSHPTVSRLTWPALNGYSSQNLAIYRTCRHR